ncbi:MAG: delta-aminolevulinic acid dehydratase [Chryseolinea sp.]
MRDAVVKSFTDLEHYCAKEGFRGWDPYDGLNSKVFSNLPFFPDNRLARLVWIQFFKKMPVNLRPILRVDKGTNPKGLALFISGYSRLSRIAPYASDATHKLKELAEALLSLRTNGFSGNCWGYNFDWESRAFFQKKYTPTIVATTFASNSLIDAYEATREQAFLDAAISSKNFIIKDLSRTYKGENFAFSYSPFDQTSVFNASLLGARLLSRIYHYTKEDELIDLARKAVAYACEYQNSDGSWYYSPLPFHQWIDNFHTGFNLECISEYGHYSGDKSFVKNFDNGLNYYLKTFFDEEGRSKYYNNSLYPVDIHAPSQLVITLDKANLFQQNIMLIDRVINWTIENMQSQKGYFYFQKRRLYTNKIPYMRWSQGWIFYALACYINQTHDVNENLV